MKTGRLTYNALGNDDEVDDVQAVGEVVLSERDDLQKALDEEDDDEDEVDPVQYFLFLYSLHICLHHQSHCVHADHHHHEDFKIRVGHQVKEQSLALILKGQEEEEQRVLQLDDDY